MSATKRRLGGWGFDGESFPPSLQLLAWLADRVGPAEHPVPTTAAAPPEMPTRDLGLLPAEVSIDPHDRLGHARGQGLADVLRLRSGLVPALPDGVCRPANVGEVEAVLQTCAARDIRVIPWGGGTRPCPPRDGQRGPARRQHRGHPEGAAAPRPDGSGRGAAARPGARP